MLHMLMQSPVSTNIPEFLKYFSKTDDFVALQDGVLIVLKNNFFYKEILKKIINRYVLKKDLIARGILKLNKEFHLIDYEDLVKLTEKNSQQIIWK